MKRNLNVISGYTNKNALKYHNSTKHESTEAKFNCEFCGTQFVNARNLELHIKSIHEPNSCRPEITCKICEKSFSQTSSLNRHMKENHKEVNANEDYVVDIHDLIFIQCEHCEKEFKRKSDLTRHVLSIHSTDDKKIQCPYCDSKLSRKDAFKRHLKSKHTLVSSE